MTTIYKSLSEQRKKGQENHTIPDWYTTFGYQMFQEKYRYKNETVRDRFQSIADTAAQYLPPEWGASKKFFELLWKGWLSPSTPVLANMGTDRGLPVSCSGGVIYDSIDGFYTARREAAILTKHGFGTSSYLGWIRPRGSDISIGGKASGILPVVKGFVQDMRDVAQGQQRRGAWAGYLPIQHPDFYELCDYVLDHPDDLNIGWVVDDVFMDALIRGTENAIKRFQRALKVKMVTGKGYFYFVDKVNRHRPSAYVQNNLYVKASNLCSEINLFSDPDHTFTCVLSSMNLAKFDEWENTDAVFWSTVFLDCVAEHFLRQGRGISGLEKAIRFTEKSRALGLGVMGFHTFLMKNRLAFESLEASYANVRIFKYLQQESKKASMFLAERFGEPEWCQGTNSRNSHCMAIAPTKSTSVMMGGVSEGINPDPAFIFTQTTSAGEIERINPVILNIMKVRGVYNKKNINNVVDNFGSVQHVDWLDREEKVVFRTAFEMNQHTLVRMASQRSKYIDQGQSVNLFFPSDTDEEEIASVHRQAFLDPNLLALYYIYSKSGVSGSKENECLACQ